MGHEEGEEAIRHIRNRYAATLSMADHWLGKLLDKLDTLGLWEDTAIMLTTDHGYLIGEHGYWAKNYMMTYKEIAHIPLLLHVPMADKTCKRVNALTSTIDIMPTLLDLHGCCASAPIHGKSLLHLTERAERHHESVLFGYFARDVNWTDGTYTYCRQPAEGSVAYMHTAMPVRAAEQREQYAGAAMGDFLPHAGMPVYRVPGPSMRHHGSSSGNPIFDLRSDPGQLTPLEDPLLERELTVRLLAAMERFDALQTEYDRLGLRREKERT